MPDLRRFDLEDLLHRPGTYINLQTEMLIVVDDGANADAELLADADGDDWILVSDELPIDADRRDELVEALEKRARRAGGGVRAASAVLDDDDEDEGEGEEGVEELDEHGFSTGDLDDQEY